MEKLIHQIQDYWNNRAEGYSAYNQEELKDERTRLWKKELIGRIRAAFPDKANESIRVLDIGTGPGFFARILAEEGFYVTAVDVTDNMLTEARKNAGDLASYISFVLADVQHLPFNDYSYDVVIMRNVTWNLGHPDQAYREWLRVLDDGGIILNYDANWYGYLYNEAQAEGYAKDRQNAKAQNIEDANEGEYFDVCEEIAKELPLSGRTRPEWDAETMQALGYETIAVDENIWEKVWSEDEKVIWASTPMFLVSGRKAERKERVRAYWNKRSESFLTQKRMELHDEIRFRWEHEIVSNLPAEKKLKILDVGCGTGFFTIILAQLGHEVTGIDLTENMIEAAKCLQEEEGVRCDFRVMDAEDLEFPDETFDVVISRNLTWTLPHPGKAYHAWVRVLKKGGILLNFDANYGIEKTKEMAGLPTAHAHNMLDVSMLAENDAIKAQMPISRHQRPAWDVELLSSQPVSAVNIDFDLSKRIFLKKDIFYNPTEMFMLRAVRR